VQIGRGSDTIKVHRVMPNNNSNKDNIRRSENVDWGGRASFGAFMKRGNSGGSGSSDGMYHIMFIAWRATFDETK
jgi:hypothetical protein